MKRYEVYFSPDLDLDAGRVLRDFSLPWVDRDPPETTFRAVWNEDTFRFRFEVEDRDLVLDPSSDPDAAVLGSDRVELFFASRADLEEPYYGLEMDPRGGVYDYRAVSYRRIDDSWKFPGLETRGSLTESGYDLEGTLPVSALLDLNLLVERRMITGVYRAEFSHGDEGVVEDWMPWVDPGTEAPDFHVPASFGEFVFREPGG